MTPVCLRDLTVDELVTVKRLAHSHIAPAQHVQRALIIWRARSGESASAIAARLGLDGETVRKRIHRFNAEGLGALTDRDRSDRPSTYTSEQTATVTATALTKPQTLGLPFAAWMLDRLATYLHKHKGIAMQRSRIDEILLHEGLRWRKHEIWFGERVNPAFHSVRSLVGSFSIGESLRGSRSDIVRIEGVVDIHSLNPFSTMSPVNGVCETEALTTFRESQAKVGEPAR
jgi:transposase